MNDMQARDLFAPDSVAPVRTDGFVLCDFSGITLAIRRSDVATIEHAQALAAPLPGEMQLGWFESSAGPWAVYGLDDELQLIDHLPDNRAFLVFLKTNDGPLGLLCEAVRILGNANALNAHPLPEVMRYGDHPIEAISRIESKRIAFIVAEGSLVPHLVRLSTVSASAMS